MNAILYFHQGYTDIVNCMSFITIYNKQYNLLHVVIRNDFLPIVQFYIRHMNNVDIIPLDNHTTITNVVDVNSYDDVLFIGVHDVFRKDKYKGVFGSSVVRPPSFVDSFYTFYGIDSMERVNSFEFVRDYELETQKYNEIVKDNNEYVLYHEGQFHLPKIDNSSKIIYLDHSTELFFDYIKILENAKEIHMIDSVWACFVYLLDCKYKLFHNKPIYVYCKRFYSLMFSSPIKLNHWTLIS